MNPQDMSTDPVDRPLGELFGDFTRDLGTLVRKEMELAKVEAKEEIRQAGATAAMSLEAAMGAWMAVLFVSLAVAWWLDQAINTGLAFFIVGVVWGVIGAVLLKAAKERAERIRVLPETQRTLKEDVQWARTQTN